MHTTHEEHCGCGCGHDHHEHEHHHHDHDHECCCGHEHHEHDHEHECCCGHDHHEHHHHHEHGEECTCGCGGHGHEHKCEEAIVLEYMMDHQKQHLAELKEIAVYLHESGKEDSAKQLEKAIDNFEKGIARVNMAISDME